MCLDTGKVFKRTTSRVIPVYKILRKTSLGLFLPMQGIKEILPSNKWVRSGDYNSGGTDSIPFRNLAIQYPSGFHCFLSFKDAKSWSRSYFDPSTDIRVYKTKARRIVARGTQDNSRVVVAEEILIPKRRFR